jgi:hypothetical protein
MAFSANMSSTRSIGLLAVVCSRHICIRKCIPYLQLESSAWAAAGRMVTFWGPQSVIEVIADRLTFALSRTK